MVVLAALLVGCVGNDARPPGSVTSSTGASSCAARDLCAALTPDELAAIFGGPVTTSSDDPRLCSFRRTSRPAVAAIQVMHLDNLSLEDQRRWVGGERGRLFGRAALFRWSEIWVSTNGGYDVPGVLSVDWYGRANESTAKRLLRALLPYVAGAESSAEACDSRPGADPQALLFAQWRVARRPRPAAAGSLVVQGNQLRRHVANSIDV